MGLALVLGLGVSAALWRESTAAFDAAKWQAYVAGTTATVFNLEKNNRGEARRRLEACPEEHRGWVPILLLDITSMIHTH